MAESEVKKGDEVSWQWGGGQPGGVAADVKAGEVSMTTARGNEVKRQGDEENPAVRVERSGHDVVKKASELDVEAEGPEHKKASGDDAGEGSATANGEKGKEEGGLKAPAAKGRGRSKSPKPPTAAESSASKADGAAKSEDKKDEGLKPPAAAGRGKSKSKSPKPPASPKPETSKETAKGGPKPQKEQKETQKPANGEKKKDGRPKGSVAKKSDDKPKKRAATDTGEPRRSKRNKAS